MVGLTKVRGEKEVKIALTKRRREISVVPHTENKKIEEESAVVVKGRLNFANKIRNARSIKLEEANGDLHTIIVPEGMMDDIVKPLWDEVVVVTGYKKNKKIHLREISEAED